MRTLSALASASTFATVVTLSLSGFAAPEGANCEVNTDCDGNLICEVTGAYGCAAPACEPGQECPEPTCESGEIRTCVAPPCQSDVDCGPGLRCVRDTYESCTDCAVPAGEPAPADCGGCVTETYTACVPKLCATNADCGDPDLVCIQETWESCEDIGMACAPGVECTAPASECQTESVSFCGPKYLGPCQVAADCGEGFECVPEQSCACSGSGGVDVPVDPDADPMPEPVEPPVEECTCEPTGRNYCEPQQIECPTGSECPTDWECVASPETTVACAPGMECPAPQPAPPVCQPPMWGALEALGESQAGAATADDRSLMELLEAPAADPADSPNAAGSESNDSGGCSVAGSGSSSPAAFGLFALLGLALVGRRRR
jgi:MYXO-CTERM domain-containing protein